MRWTQLLIPTEKNDPADASTAHQRLMIRAGLMRQLGSGVYGLLPLGMRTMRKIQELARRHFTEIGGSEILLPGDQSVAELVSGAVRSYRQLPLKLFHFAAAIEEAERYGPGLLKLRESPTAAWDMFHAPSDVQAVNDETIATLQAIAEQCGLAPVVAECDAGASLVVPADAGEETLLISDRGNYAALSTAARTGDRAWSFAGSPSAELKKLHTPGLSVVEQVAAAVGVTPRDGLKTLIIRTDASGPALSNGVNPRWVIAVVRGDHELSFAKVSRAARETFQVGLRPLEETDELKARFTVGFVGPHVAARTPDAVLIVDPDAAQEHANWVTGANEVGYHVAHFNWFRECGDLLADPKRTLVADIRVAQENDPSPSNDGGRLVSKNAIEIATIASKVDSGTTALDDAGRPMTVGICTARINLAKLLAAIVELNHDDNGITWPPGVAPFHVVITPIKYAGEVKSAADALYPELNEAGFDTLLDDRDARPGFKFADADLIGFPIRINIGDKKLKEGNVELKRRGAADTDVVPLNSAASTIHTLKLFPSTGEEE